MAEAAPPAFEEASQCAVCGCTFGTFKRRHHCRACGRSLCSDHSSNQMALPQFGLHAPVRVCRDCLAGEDRAAGPPAGSKVSNDIDSSISSFSKLQFDDTDKASNLPAPEAVVPIPVTEAVEDFECKCGMPLCICSTPDSGKAPPSAPPAVASVKHKRAPPVSAAPKQVPSTTSVKSSPSLFFSSGQSVQAESQDSRTYDTTGEGMREAIKNGDADAVKDLLAKGVDANYLDKQGMSLLHLAAVFNLTEISFMLMDSGASVHAKNAQGETPLDCAQTTLRYKLQQRLQELDG